jgi:hypothetical protein
MLISSSNIKYTESKNEGEDEECIKDFGQKI